MCIYIYIYQIHVYIPIYIYFLFLFLFCTYRPGHFTQDRRLAPPANGISQTRLGSDCNPRRPGLHSQKEGRTKHKKQENTKKIKRRATQTTTTPTQSSSLSSPSERSTLKPFILDRSPNPCKQKHTKAFANDLGKSQRQKYGEAE